MKNTGLPEEVAGHTVATRATGEEVRAWQHGSGRSERCTRGSGEVRLRQCSAERSARHGAVCERSARYGGARSGPRVRKAKRDEGERGEDEG